MYILVLMSKMSKLIYIYIYIVIRVIPFNWIQNQIFHEKLKLSKKYFNKIYSIRNILYKEFFFKSNNSVDFKIKLIL